MYSIDTGWVTNYNGNCAVEAHVDYYPGSDTAYIHTTVQDPYLFAACRVHTHVWVQTKSNVFAGAAQGAMACAVLDPSCASTQSYTGTFSGQTPGLTALVDSVNQVLVDKWLAADVHPDAGHHRHPGELQQRLTTSLGYSRRVSQVRDLRSEKVPLSWHNASVHDIRARAAALAVGRYRHGTPRRAHFFM